MRISMKLDEKIVKDAHVLIHPIRFRIVALLKEEPLHINAISSAMGMERRLVAYHLGVLEESGFLTSKYEMSEEKKSKGRAIRKCWVTNKVDQVMSEIKKGL
jgi:predicted transcriptional regulator